MHPYLSHFLWSPNPRPLHARHPLHAAILLIEIQGRIGIEVYVLRCAAISSTFRTVRHLIAWVLYRENKKHIPRERLSMILILLVLHLCRVTEDPT